MCLDEVGVTSLPPTPSNSTFAGMSRNYRREESKIKWKKKTEGTSPDSPVVKTLSFQSRGYRFDPWWGN